MCVCGGGGGGGGALLQNGINRKGVYDAEGRVARALNLSLRTTFAAPRAQAKIRSCIQLPTPSSDLYFIVCFEIHHYDPFGVNSVLNLGNQNKQKRLQSDSMRRFSFGHVGVVTSCLVMTLGASSSRRFDLSYLTN